MKNTLYVTDWPRRARKSQLSYAIWRYGGGEYRMMGGPDFIIIQDTTTGDRVEWRFVTPDMRGQCEAKDFDFESLVIGREITKRPKDYCNVLRYYGIYVWNHGLGSIEVRDWRSVSIRWLDIFWHIVPWCILR